MDLSEFEDRGYDLYTMSALDVIRFAGEYLRDHDARHPDDVASLVGFVEALQDSLASGAPELSPGVEADITSRFERADFEREIAGIPLWEEAWS